MRFRLYSPSGFSWQTFLRPEGAGFGFCVNFREIVPQRAALRDDFLVLITRKPEPNLHPCIAGKQNRQNPTRPAIRLPVARYVN